MPDSYLVEVNEHRVEIDEGFIKVDIEMDEWVAKQNDGPYVVVNDNLSDTSLDDKQREYAIKSPDEKEITDAYLDFYEKSLAYVKRVYLPY